MKKHIAVLKGGWSAEREVSLNSGDACAIALRELGYRVTEIDMQPDIAQVLAELRPDIAFNALHGRFGEDGCIQGVLEILQIPYTHSGLLASCMAMDKPMAKKIFAAAGLRCPHGREITQADFAKGDPLPRPYVVKPANEGSSVGVYIITCEDNKSLAQIMEAAPSATLAATQSFLTEEYIPGRELTVALLDNQPLAVTEIRTHDGFYDYANKYTAGGSEHIIPAPIPQAVADEAMRMALTAHQALGCRGLSRADFRWDDTKGEKDGLYLLEVNTQPGMTNLSLSPEQAAFTGISFNALVERLVAGARLGN